MVSSRCNRLVVGEETFFHFPSVATQLSTALPPHFLAVLLLTVSSSDYAVGPMQLRDYRKLGDISLEDMLAKLRAVAAPGELDKTRRATILRHETGLRFPGRECRRFTGWQQPKPFNRTIG
jgi:hypothetical protein